MNAGGDEHTLVAGLMRLDYTQEHYHTSLLLSDTNEGSGNAVPLALSGVVAVAGRGTGDAWITGHSQVKDMTASNNVTPRPDKRTHGADVGVYTYIYAGTVN